METKRSILIVEDDDVDAEILVKLFRVAESRPGVEFELHREMSLAGALTALASASYELVFLDAKEVERIRVLREGIGEDIDLMCDINQLWDVNQAIDIGRRVEEYHLFWLEDVVAHDDFQGLARVADALTTPVCAGEYHYGIRPFRHMLEARSIDIVMIDLLRAGGITQWMKIAGMAQAFNEPVVSHLIPEVHVHLVAAIPHGLTVEYMPWTLRLFEETPAIEDGQIVVPQKPGLGLKFDEGALRQFDIS
jgi:L-alanine-DL-glutamate epimerase-like enolase superfamily enzyme